MKGEAQHLTKSGSVKSSKGSARDDHISDSVSLMSDARDDMTSTSRSEESSAPLDSPHPSLSSLSSPLRRDSDIVSRESDVIHMDPSVQ